MTEQTYIVHLDVSALVVIGDDCDGREELRSIRFVDINDGIGIDISDFEKNGETIKQVLSDRLPEAIMAAHRKQNRIER